LGALLDGARGPRSTHCGSDPSRTDRIDPNGRRREFPGQNPGKGVESHLGDAVGVGRPAPFEMPARFYVANETVQQVYQIVPRQGGVEKLIAQCRRQPLHLSHGAGDHDDATVWRQQRAQLIGDRHRPETVDREGAAGYVGIESLQRDTGVVDESIDVSTFPLQGVCQCRHAGRIGHVQRMVAHCQPLTLKLVRRRSPLGRVAAGEHHPEAALGQLAAGFQAKTPVAAGDDRKLLTNFYHLQVISSYGGMNQAKFTACSKLLRIVRAIGGHVATCYMLSSETLHICDHSNT